MDGLTCKTLIGAAALSTALGPAITDGIVLARAHMENPRWLPHAKLHCAMSFFGSFGLGIGSLLVLVSHSAHDRFAMGIAAFLASIFWFGLLASRLFPGTSFGFRDDPDHSIQPVRFLGISIHGNALSGIVSIVVAWTGFVLAIAQW